MFLVKFTGENLFAISCPTPECSEAPKESQLISKVVDLFGLDFDHFPQRTLELGLNLTNSARSNLRTIKASGDQC